jgi:hypothetical protein
MQDAIQAAERMNRNLQSGIFCLQEAANAAISSCALIPPSELLPLLSMQIAERVEETIRKQPCFTKPADQLPSEDAIGWVRRTNPMAYEELVSLIYDLGEYNLTVFFNVSDEHR